MALEALVHSERVNAVAGWILLGTVALAAAASLLANAVLWGGFSLLVVAVASLPAASTRDWTAMVPWPLLAVAAAAAVARAAGRYPETAGYLAIATLALVVVVELDVFTPVELSHRFAVVFAVMTTMAVQSLWIVTQFYSDAWLGTEFLRSETELQVDIVIVTVVGFVVGASFYWYVTRVEPAGIAARSTSDGRDR